MCPRCANSSSSANDDEARSMPNDPTDSTEGRRGKSRQQQQPGVSQVFNRALGSILSTGDMFGGVGGSRVGLGREKFRRKIGRFRGMPAFDLEHINDGEGVVLVVV